MGYIMRLYHVLGAETGQLIQCKVNSVTSKLLICMRERTINWQGDNYRSRTPFTSLILDFELRIDLTLLANRNRGIAGTSIAARC